MNLPPITIDCRPRPHKRSRYIPDLLPVSISVASENTFSTLATPSDFPDILPSDDPNTLRVMSKYSPFLDRAKIGYCFRKQDKNMLQKGKVILLHMIL